MVKKTRGRKSNNLLDENPTIYELYNAEKKVAKDIEERFKRQ